MNSDLVVRRSGVVVALLGMAFSLLAACRSDTSSGAAAPSRSAGVHSYVGTVEGTGALLSVVVDRSGALAYVCDGVPADPARSPPTIRRGSTGRQTAGA